MIAYVAHKYHQFENEKLIKVIKDELENYFAFDDDDEDDRMLAMPSFPPRPIQTDKDALRVISLNDDAYWIEDNKVYTAKIIDGRIYDDSKNIVDMHSLNDVELDKMIFIIEKLTEGLEDDDRNSGN
jgi:hypothetical protein